MPRATHTHAGNPFAAELRRACAQATAPDPAPSLRLISAVSGVGRTAIGQWLKGASLPRSWHDGAAPVVDALVRIADRHGRPFPDPAAVRQRCRDAYRAAKRAAAGKPSGTDAPRRGATPPAVGAIPRPTTAVDGAGHGPSVPAGDAAAAPPVPPGTVLAPPLGQLPPVRGRERLLRELVDRLADHTAGVDLLVGMGGCGKSTLALKLAEHARAQGHPVWWVPADSGSALAAGMLALAAELCADPRELAWARTSLAATADLVWRLLDAHPRRWLLICDNADDPADLAPVGDLAGGTGWVRPSPAGMVLVTSRVTDASVWGNHARLLRVGTVPAAVGARILLDRVPEAHPARNDQERARALSDRLGGLPLALHLAGSYLGSDLAGLDLAGYLEQAARSVRLLDLAAVGAHQAGDPRSRTATTWELSLATLAEHGVPQARPLLRLLSCYAPGQRFPVRLLDAHLLARHGLLAADDPETALFAGLTGLVRFGLLSSEPGADPGERAVVVHPLVADASRLRNSEDDGCDRVQAAAAALLCAEADRLDLVSSDDWPAWRALHPHARALLGRLDTADGEVVAGACHALNRSVDASLQMRLGADQEEQIRDLLDRAAALGLDHEEHIAARRNLATLLWRSGRHAEAERVSREVLASERRSLGDDHPRVLGSMANIAWSLVEQGRYEEAERAHREVLAAESRVLGPHHLETLIARHNLALTLFALRRLTEAEEIQRQVVVDREAVLGEHHVMTLNARMMLARILAHRGQGEVAETLARTTFDHLVERVGARERPVHRARTHLAEILARRGKDAAATRMYREALDAQREWVGEDHPYALEAAHGLAEVLARRGQRGEAERLYEDTLRRRRRVLGGDHPKTRATADALAALRGGSDRASHGERASRDDRRGTREECQRS